MVGKYILTLDIGTTNIKAFLFDNNGVIVAEAKERPNYILDEPGKVEQDPKEIWEMSKKVMEEVLKNKSATSGDIDSVAISTQRASFCLWDKKTGKLYSNTNTWQDKRCAAFAKKKTKSFLMRMVRAITKVIYLLTRNTKMLTASMLQYNTDHASVRTGFFLLNNPELLAAIQNPKTSVLWGTIDTWILWNLTKGELHATDYSNASATGLLDPFTLKWNALPLSMFKIPVHILPEIRATRGDFGSTSLFGGGEIPIRAVIADQQASLFASGAKLKCTLGTGSFVDFKTGNAPYASRERLYPLVAWYLNKEVTDVDEEGRSITKTVGEAEYLLEGFNHNTGNIVDWIRDELGFYNDPAESEKMALKYNSTNGIYFLPAFTSGISFPYWSDTRGNIFGLSLDTKKEHIVRAVLEGICYRIKDIVDGILKDTKLKIDNIILDGGVSQNKFVLQFLSNILGINVEKSGHPETTALGATFMAGLETGFWKSEDEINKIRKVEAVYKPQISKEERKANYNAWKNVIKRSLDFKY